MSESFALSTSDDADNDLTTVATKMRTAITITGTVTERIVRPAWKVERAKILQKRFPKEPRNRTSQALVMDQYFKLAPFDSLSLKQQSLKAQEKLAIKSLIGIFTGIEGDHIRGERLSKTEIQWNVDPGFDPCLNSLIYKCLPLADARDSIVRFIEAIEWDHRRGRVARAVASTMSAFVEEDWMLAVMELETMLNANSLTVAEVYARTRLLQNALSLLADIAAAIDQQELVGGEILSLLDEKRSSNVDPHVIGLLDRLLEKAVVPYLRSLDAWVFYGQVDDVSLDFMIWDTENELMSAVIQQQIIPQDDLDEFDSIGDSFDRRYRLIGDLCPTFLRPVAQDILKCGKYLHIVDQCGVERKEKDGGSDKHLTWKSTGGASALVKVIEVARIAASVALVDILLKRYDLLALFRSVRRFLLVGQCDWLMIFMQVADDLLAKDADCVDETALSTRFEVAILNSSVKNDPYKDLFRVYNEATSLTEYLNFIANIDHEDSAFFDAGNRARLTLEAAIGLKGFDTVSLDVTTEWPLSIVFHKKAVVQYQIVFRRLFSLHRAFKLLISQWQHSRRDVCPAENLLRSAMLSFTSNYLSYCCTEVIKPRWERLEKELKELRSVEDVLMAQSRFLDDVNKDCMLTDAPLINATGDIVQLITEFALNHLMPYDKVQVKFDRLKSDLVEQMRLLGADPVTRNTAWIHFAHKILS